MRTGTSEFIEHDAWRLGYLLTGTSAGAAAALERVLRAHEDVRKLSEDRRRRLVVMGARDWLITSGGWQGDPIAATLEALPREAWFLSIIRGWGDIEVSRAMGVSRAALAGYLASATSRLTSSLGDRYQPATQALRSTWEQADAGPGVEATRQRARRWTVRRRIGAAIKFALLAAVLALFAWIGRDLLRAADREREHRALGESLSNPMPAPRSDSPGGGKP